MLSCWVGTLSITAALQRLVMRHARCPLPRSAFVSLALRLGFNAALCKNGDPKPRRAVQSEVAAHRAAAACSSEKVSTRAGRGSWAPRIGAVLCDELSDSADSLLLKLMRHNAIAHARASSHVACSNLLGSCDDFMLQTHAPEDARTGLLQPSNTPPV